MGESCLETKLTEMLQDVEPPAMYGLDKQCIYRVPQTFVKLIRKPIHLYLFPLALFTMVRKKTILIQWLEKDCEKGLFVRISHTF